MAVSNLKAELQKYGKLYKEKFESQLKSDDTYASGDLSRSVKYKTNSTDSYSELSLLADSYMEQISEGRRKGVVPSSTKIERWLKIKGIRPDARIKKGSDDYKMKKLAFVIARSIASRGMIERYGFKGTNIIDFVYNSLSEQMGNDLFEAYKKDLEAQLKEQVK